MSLEQKSEPLLQGHDPNFAQGMPPNAFPPQPPGFAPPPPGYGPPPAGYGQPPANLGPSGPMPPAPMDDLEAPFKIKGVVELQKEFNAEEVRIVKKQPHICSLLINMMVWASRLFVIITLVSYNNRPSSWRREMEFLANAWFLFLIPEVVSLIEFFCSSTLRYLWNKTQSDSIREYVVKMKETRPSISMWCECYHYETRVRYVTESYTVNGPNGPETRTRQRLETYEEKVVTFTDSEYFDYSHFFEISRMISDDIYHNDLIKIRFSEKIEFGDPYTRGAYDRQLSSFIARNKHRDVCFSYTENKSTPGFKERMFSMNGEEHSCLVHWFWYTLISLLGFSWPFRMWIESKCVRGEFKFQYVVFRDPSRFGY